MFGQGRASKTQQFDESLVLNTPGREWVGLLALRLRDRAAPNAPLVSTTLTAWTQAFKSAASELGVDDVHLYLLRHSGPSDDFLMKARDLRAIKKRGRWSDDRSVRRYEKSARALKQASDLPVYVQRYARTCQLEVHKVMLDGKQPPLLTPVMWESRKRKGGV
jgi:integrase